MALFKHFRGSRASLNVQPLHDGYAYFCTDDGTFHIDYADANGNLHRKQISAKEAEKLTGYNIATILNSSDVEIPTSKSVKEYVDNAVVNAGGSKIELDATLTKSGQAADAKAVGDAINELNNKSLDRVTSYDFSSGDNEDIDVIDNGIWWKNSEVEIELDGGDQYITSASSANRVPIVAGNGISFEVDRDNQVVKINNVGYGVVGTWVFNDVLTQIDKPFENGDELVSCSGVVLYDAYDEKQDFQFSKILFHRSPETADEIILRNANEDEHSIYYGSEFCYGFEHRTITFTEEPIDEVFIAWLRANATKTAGAPAPAPAPSEPVSFMTRINHSELKSLRDNSKLIPGMFYRITDYVCTTAQADTRAMNNKFDIIVQALSENTLSENASADYHWVEGVVEGVTFNPSVVGDDTMLVGGTVIPYYYEYIDVSDSEGGMNEYKQTDIFIAYGYLENNNGVTVPVIYKTDEVGVGEEPDPEFEDPDYEDIFYYVGTANIDGVTYDKWRKIERSGEARLTWDSTGKAYLYTNIITVVPKDESIQPNVANLHAWELKYCLDNDTTRFAWAMDGTAIVNLESILSNGQPLTRQPEFDGCSGNDEYYYAWGTQADVDDADVNNFWYSKSDELLTGDEVMTIEGSYDIVEVAELGKGVIYYMKDEHGNECPYDFKNITFIFDEEETFTFSDEEGCDVSMGGAVYNNRIESLRDGVAQILNRVAIKSTGEIKDVTLISGVHDRILDVSEISAPVVYRPSGSMEIILD